MGKEERQAVRQRRVFYIPGYDPVHPRRYREIYRRESAEQARISGYEIELKPKKTKGPFGWHVQARIDDTPVTADVDVLVWSDIVRESMSNSIAATYGQLVRTAWIYIGSGTMRRLMWLRKGPVVAALYPIVALLLQLIAALLIACVTWWVVAQATAIAGLDPNGAGRWVSLGGLAVGLGLGWWLLNWFRASDNRILAYYLMHDYAHSSQLRGAYPPDLEARLAQFVDTIAAALQDPQVDEVLVVGHSSGAHLAVSVLADLIRAGRVPADGPALALLSLGQVVPMMSFLPRADRLRADLAYLSTRSELAWVDVTAPGDGCAFALCDPVTVSGVAPPDKIWPLVFSAAFTESLSPDRWNELKRQFFRLHFQYLCAFDRPRDYDYFQITAGPLTLRDRYAGRPPSKSRIDRPVSKYTSVRAA